MSKVIEGQIEKIHTKSGQGKRGTWTKYSAIINGGWVNFGFDRPAIQEGDTVKLTVEENQYGFEVKSCEKVADAPPAQTSVPVATGKIFQLNEPPAGGYNKNQEGQAWGNASNVAAALIEVLVAVDGLPLTASAGKASKAKRFDEVIAIYDKLRVKLFEDSKDIQRVIDGHPDFGAIQNVSPSTLPDAEEEENDPAGSHWD